MLLNILLLSILFIGGIFNLFFYFGNNKFYAWFQSLFSSSSTSTISSTNPATTGNSSKSSFRITAKEEKKKKIDERDTTSELRRVFATFDKDSDGFITKQELGDSLRNIRIFLSEKEIEDVVTKLDSNGDGLIDFEEFGSLCESMLGDDQERVVVSKRNHDDDGDDHDDHDDDDDEEEELIKEAFDVFDKDKDGLISVEELGAILSSLGLNEGKRAQDCKAMIKKVDMDGDGMVNFQEFKKMMKSGGNILLPS